VADRPCREREIDLNKRIKLTEGDTPDYAAKNAAGLEAGSPFYSTGLSQEGTRHPAVCICTDCVHPFSLIISFLVINSRAMGSTSTNHGDGHIGIDSVKN
jgi:hypothetical protein